MQDDREAPLMTPEQVRREFFHNKVGRNWVYEQIRSGALPATKLGDRYFLSRKRLSELLEGDNPAVAAR